MEGKEGLTSSHTQPACLLGALEPACKILKSQPLLSSQLPVILRTAVKTCVFTLSKFRPVAFNKL